MEKQERKEQEKLHGKGGGKGQGKTRHSGAKGKGPLAPRFDLSKICPKRNLVAWQRLETLLEKGETATDKSLDGAVCILDSCYRLAEAHGLALKTLLICKAENETFEEDGGKCEMLPYMGNLALVKARIACLNKLEPTFKGETPLTTEAPGISEEEEVSLRIMATDLSKRQRVNESVPHPFQKTSCKGWMPRKGTRIPNDGRGDCLFHAVQRALADLEPRKQRLARQLRAFAVAYMKRHTEGYEALWGRFAPGQPRKAGDDDWNGIFLDYLDGLQLSGCWPTYLECFALAASLQRLPVKGRCGPLIMKMGMRQLVSILILTLVTTNSLLGPVEHELRQWAKLHSGRAGVAFRQFYLSHLHCYMATQACPRPRKSRFRNLRKPNGGPYLLRQHQPAHVATCAGTWGLTKAEVLRLDAHPQKVVTTGWEKTPPLQSCVWFRNLVIDEPWNPIQVLTPFGVFPLCSSIPLFLLVRPT